MEKKQLVMSGLAAFFDAHPPELKGVGVCNLPGIPPHLQIQPGDMERDPLADSHSLGLQINGNDVVGLAWIRRALSAEAFSKALEKELEKLRGS